MAGIIALALTGVGIFLILVGVWVSLDEYKKKNAGLKPEDFSGGTLEGLAKLAEALKNYPLGMQLIFVGVALMLAGGTVGGVSSL